MRIRRNYLLLHFLSAENGEVKNRVFIVSLALRRLIIAAISWGFTLGQFILLLLNALKYTLPLRYSLLSFHHCIGSIDTVISAYFFADDDCFLNRFDWLQLLGLLLHDLGGFTSVANLKG